MKGETEEEGFRISLYNFRTTAALLELQSCSGTFLVLSGELGGDRTHDPRLKRALLYQLSYELSPTTSYLYSIRCRKLSLLTFYDILALVIK